VSDPLPPPQGLVHLEWRPFAFSLPSPLLTASGGVGGKRGWLLRLETATGAVGWGEAAPLAWTANEAAAYQLHAGLVSAIRELGLTVERSKLEQLLPQLPLTMGFALGAALAEIDGMVGPLAGGWLRSPPSAWLLPAGEAAITRLERLLEQVNGVSSSSESHAAPSDDGCSPGSPDALLKGREPGQGSLTLKWKVVALEDGKERMLLERLLERFPPSCRLRLDANGGWERATARAWADRLADEPSLEWLEQPLPPSDPEGLKYLADRVPVALDESLRSDPALRRHWPGWQVRRPSQEGDPRPLLIGLRAGQSWRMVSTGFETGIGRRWLHQLAALQARGPTPAAPGLAPGWTPTGGLFSTDPEEVWEAARCSQ